MQINETFTYGSPSQPSSATTAATCLQPQDPTRRGEWRAVDWGEAAVRMNVKNAVLEPEFTPEQQRAARVLDQILIGIKRARAKVGSKTTMAPAGVVLFRTGAEVKLNLDYAHDQRFEC
jgi:hypothetical protein